jgi:DNA-directed RNA polymerase II subunit RPB1
MDAVYIEHQKFESLCLAKKDFLQMYELTVNDDNFGLDVTTGLHFMEVDIIESCKNDPEIQFLLDRELEVLKEDQASLRLIMASREIERESDPLSYAPGNIRRIIANAIQHFRINRREPSDLHPKDIIAKVNSLIEKLNVVQGKDSLSVEAQANATLLYGILVRSILASKRVLLEFRLNEISLDWILAEIKAKFFRAKVNPGEMTGVLAAQSISEPVTQMTLDVSRFFLRCFKIFSSINKYFIT